MDIIIYTKILVPIATSLIGVFAGYLIARSRYRSDKERGTDKLALDLVEREWERLSSQDQTSDFSSIAHWAVLRKLLDEFQNNKEKVTNLEELRDDFDSKYTCVCSTYYAKKFLKLSSELNKININKTDKEKIQKMLKIEAKNAFSKEKDSLLSYSTPMKNYNRQKR